MKILIVTTVSETVNAFLKPHIKMLKEMGHDVDLGFSLNNSKKGDLYEIGRKVYDIPFQRNVLSNNFILLIKLLRNIIESEKYDVIHTHTPIASVFVRLACKKIPTTKVIYTAHGFHFFKGASKLSWMLYFPIEKILSKHTDALITINKEDYHLAKKKFSNTKVFFINGVGLENKTDTKNSNDYWKEFRIDKSAYVLMSIGELNSNKNHMSVLKGLEKTKHKNWVYLIAGVGPLEKQLKETIESSDVLRDKVILLGYRNDVRQILHDIVDLFVFPSLREGLPVSVMEAMYEGLPVIGSDIRGVRDLIQETQMLVNTPTDSNEWEKKISTSIQNKLNLKKIGLNNKNRIVPYMLENVLCDLKKIYNQIF